MFNAFEIAELKATGASVYEFGGWLGEKFFKSTKKGITLDIYFGKGFFIHDIKSYEGLEFDTLIDKLKEK